MFAASEGRLSPARFTRFVAAVLQWSALAAAASPAAANAAEPSLAFDFPRMVECRELPAEEYPQLFAGEKVIEATIQLSVHLYAGDANKVEELRVEIADPDHRMRVVDFSPQTKMESSYSQDIEWTKTTETGHSIGLSLGGELPTPIE